MKQVDLKVPSGEGSPQDDALLSCTVHIKEVHNDSDSSGLEEDEPLLQNGECRICQEEDSIENLETPCACSGSLKFAHKKCVQHWCNEKGDINCEICQQPYQPGYSAPQPPPLSDDDEIDITGVWTISGTAFDPQDPRNLAIAAAQQELLEAEYGEYAENSANGAAFCHSAALIILLGLGAADHSSNLYPFSHGS